MTAVELEDGQSVWYDVVIYGGKELTGIDAIKWAQKMRGLWRWRDTAHEQG